MFGLLNHRIRLAHRTKRQCDPRIGFELPGNLHQSPVQGHRLLQRVHLMDLQSHIFQPLTGQLQNSLKLLLSFLRGYMRPQRFQTQNHRSIVMSNRIMHFPSHPVTFL
ncbi:hypothetical protein D3C73_1400520 [compost metagenome]